MDNTHPNVQKLLQDNNFNYDGFDDYLSSVVEPIIGKIKRIKSVVEKQELRKCVIAGILDFSLNGLMNERQKSIEEKSKLNYLSFPEQPKYERVVHEYDLMQMKKKTKEDFKITPPFYFFAEIIPLALLFAFFGANLKTLVDVFIAISIILPFILVAIFIGTIVQRNKRWQRFCEEIRTQESKNERNLKKKLKYEKESEAVRQNNWKIDSLEEKIKEYDRLHSELMDGFSDLLDVCKRLKQPLDLGDFKEKTFRDLLSELDDKEKSLRNEKNLCSYMSKKAASLCSDWTSRELHRFKGFLDILETAGESVGNEGDFYYKKRFDETMFDVFVEFYNDFAEEYDDDGDYFWDCYYHEFDNCLALFNKLDKRRAAVLQTEADRKEAELDVEIQCKRCLKYPCPLWNDRDDYESKKRCAGYVSKR